MSFKVRPALPSNHFHAVSSHISPTCPAHSGAVKTLWQFFFSWVVVSVIAACCHIQLSL